MADARPEVDRRLPFALAIPGGDILDADLELQGSRDAVVNLRLVVVRTMPVLMQVDKPRRDDLPARIEHFSA